MGSGAFASPRNRGPAYDDKVRSHGLRRRFKGRRGIVVGRRSRPVFNVRSQSGSTRPTAAGHECGQDRPYNTVGLPSQYKVQMPKNRVRVP